MRWFKRIKPEKVELKVAHFINGEAAPEGDYKFFKKLMEATGEKVYESRHVLNSGVQDSIYTEDFLKTLSIDALEYYAEALGHPFDTFLNEVVVMPKLEFNGTNVISMADYKKRKEALREGGYN